MRVILGLLFLFRAVRARHVSAMDLPAVDNNMLVFDNQDHFEKVMNELISEQERVDAQEEGSTSDEEFDVFADFDRRLQFESLASEIERQLVELEESSDDGITDDNDPDEHYISDPYLRSMLNPKGMIRIGDTTYRITKDGVETFDRIDRRDLTSRQDHLRKDSNSSDSSNVVKPYLDPEKSNRGLKECCYWFESETSYQVYASGSRRIKSKQWVGNYLFYKSIGASTTNYKKMIWFGGWKSTRADMISVHGNYCWSLGSCTHYLFGDCETFSKTKYNKGRVTYVDPWINVDSTLYIREQFNSHHTAVDNGGTGNDSLHMCPLSPTPVPTPAPTAGPSCMSGNTGVFVETQQSVAMVKELQVGDTIKGLNKDKQLSECIVEAIGTFGFGNLYGNYTHDHFIYDPKSEEVIAHGAVGPMTSETKYEVFTSCPLGLDESGKAFTAIDSDFCGQREKVSWSDYVIIHTAIFRIVRASGPYWFTGSSYADLDGMISFAPRIYDSLLKCAGPERDCDDLEQQSLEFISFLTNETRAATEKAFPNMGKRGIMGSVSYTVTGP